VAKVDPAIVDINTTLDGGEAAGTGMVLTPSGLVLTNNHVIEDATSIHVQIQGTGPTYTAHIVGYDVTDDIAVIQIEGVSNLKTIGVGDSAALQVGDGVIAIGNALGTDGPHAVTTGSVVALDQTITAGGDGPDTSSETLHGLIQSSAALQPGDSGGALVNRSGQVVGMNSAALASRRRSSNSSSSVGYAIPIDHALSIAQQIVDGKGSSTIHIGDRGILGVEIAQADNANSVVVSQVQDGSPAAKAGIQQGDTITAIDGKSVSSLDDLQGVLGTRSPGDHVKVTWTDSSGQTQSATITLIAGPPA
jgi:S1-C subfamily serine protease